jgi:hypothetical protein
MRRRALVGRIGLLAVAGAVALGGVATPAVAAPVVAVSRQQDQSTKLAQKLVRQITADGANRQLRESHAGMHEHSRICAEDLPACEQGCKACSQRWTDCGHGRRCRRWLYR